MNRFLLSSALGSLLLFSGLAPAEENSRPAKPNVVLILTDDLGWQDVGCYDIDEPSPYETPHIDALAKRGVMFWQAYSPAPTCAPTRCAIMSGNHPARAQKTHVVGGAPPAPYNRTAHRMMPPWYSGRMPAGEMTLARALQGNGYATGHSGKWHMAINHSAFPQPEDQGFDWSRASLGVTRRMAPHRMTGFATAEEGDPFRLDEEGFAFDQTTVDAMEFVGKHKDEPFFLYFATWLVHTPIHTRSKERLEKYCQKLGVALPENPKEWKGEGQTNPFYCAMVEELDHYVGQLLDYLQETEDPRWPGHKLVENTYVIFTSDNGGMETHPGQIITDNYPLDRGKISAREGGTRVPLIIAGPGIKEGIQSEVMVNGLDFYPTVLSLTGAEKPAGKSFDGYDLKPLLLGDASDAALVVDADGEVRDSMMWHFPHSVAMESTIRVGGYKLIRKYERVKAGDELSGLELYQLYDAEDGEVVRVDIEEAKNLTKDSPEKAKEMNGLLSKSLTEMKASYPYFNPHTKHKLPHKDEVCTVISHEQDGKVVRFTYQENGAKVERANLIYTDNGGERYEEWYRQPAALVLGNQVQVRLPKETTHYFINLIDENKFLVSYPEVVDMLTLQKSGKKYSETALSPEN
ncbi:MAG: sulfatase-like hydrolase/transferase [Roseibacillus sp.]